MMERAVAVLILLEHLALMVDSHQPMEVLSTLTLVVVRDLDLEEKATVKDHHPPAGVLHHLSLYRLDQGGVILNSHSAKPLMAPTVAGEILCLPMVLKMRSHLPGVLKKSHLIGMIT